MRHARAITSGLSASWLGMSCFGMSWGGSCPFRRELGLCVGPSLPGKIMPVAHGAPFLRCRPRCGRGMVGGRGRRTAPVNRRQFQADHLFDVAQKGLLGAVAEGNRGALGAGPRGAADPVDIGLRHFGKLEIDDMGDTVDVDAARRDVGCDHGTGVAFTERFERTLPLALAFVAVDRAGRDPVAFKMLGHLVGAAFGSREDDRPGHFRIGEKLDEEIALAACLNKQDPVVDSVGGFRGRSDRHLDGIDEKPARERGNFVWHRRREKKVLPAFWKGTGYPPDGFHKTEVEHAIGLVEDENFGLAKARRPAIEVIFETARRRDQNVEAAREGLNLRTMRHAAEDNGSGEGKARAKTPEALGDLTRQFACRTQNQHAAAIARGGAIMRCEIMENGKREGRRLAGAGLGYANEVAPRHDGGNGLRLDRRGMRVTLFGQGMEKRRGETEPGEFSQFQSFLKRELAHLKRGLHPYGRGFRRKNRRGGQGVSRRRPAWLGCRGEAIESARKEDNVHHASRAPNPQSSRAAYMAALAPEVKRKAWSEHLRT